MKLYNYDSSRKEWNAITAVQSRRLNNEMMMVLPKRLLKATDSDFDFKWIDNIPKTTDDILDFIANGDAAPNGRFNYRFRGSQLISASHKNQNRDD